MQIIPLASIQNQTFSVTLNSQRYTFAVYQCNGIMCYDITLNENNVVNGQRIATGSFLVPFSDDGGNGNFMLLTNNFELANFQEFGASQVLIYLTDAEIQAAIDTAPAYVSPVTAYAVA